MSTLLPKDRINALMKEYRALYGLVVFRMTSLDRRLPVTGAAVVALLGGTLVAPPPAQNPLLIGVPVVLVWLLRTTINHARSLEDLLRRIEEIERNVNRIGSEDLLTFQSSHPSRHRAVGGRTGREAVWTVLTSCVLLLCACVHLAFNVWSGASRLNWAYGMYALAVALLLGVQVLSYHRYRYRKTGREAEDGLLLR